MRSLNYYVKAIELCRAMEEAGLASLNMPEHNIFLSNKIPAQNLSVAKEAVGVYVRLHHLASRLTLGLKVVSAFALATLIYQNLL